MKIELIMVFHISKQFLKIITKVHMFVNIVLFFRSGVEQWHACEWRRTDDECIECIPPVCEQEGTCVLRVWRHTRSSWSETGVYSSNCTPYVSYEGSLKCYVVFVSGHLTPSHFSGKFDTPTALHNNLMAPYWHKKNIYRSTASLRL